MAQKRLHLIQLIRILHHDGLVPLHPCTLIHLYQLAYLRTEARLQLGQVIGRADVLALRDRQEVVGLARGGGAGVCVFGVGWYLLLRKHICQVDFATFLSEGACQQ